MGKRGALITFIVVLVLAAADSAHGDHDGPATRAEAAARAAAEAGEFDCNGRVVRSDERFRERFGRGTEVRTDFEISSGSTAGTHVADWLVADNGAVLPWSPLAGNLERGCRGRGGKPKSESDWRSLPYFDGENLYLATDRTWRRAKQLSSHLPYGANAIWGTAGGYVWAKKCKRRRQEVRFKRAFWVPGKPDGRPTASIDFDAFTRPEGSIVDPVPIRKATVRINNRIVRKLKIRRKHRETAYRVAAIPRRFLKYGRNEITVDAKKQRTKGCNRNPQKPKGIDLGMEVVLSAEFAADLELRLERQAPGRFDPTKGFMDTLHVASNGPSGLYAGGFTIRYQGSRGRTTKSGGLTADSGLPRFGCETVYQQTAPGQETKWAEMSCTWGKLKRRRSGEVDIVFRYVPEVSESLGDRVDIDYRGAPGALPDPDGSNNSGTDAHRVCSTSDPDCGPA